MSYGGAAGPVVLDPKPDVVPGDPKGEWSVVARAVGGQAIELGRGLRTRLNPLDEGTRPKVWVAADGTT